VIPAPYRFVAPPAAGRFSGGFLYNSALLAALRAEGVDCDALDVEQARRALLLGAAGVFWVDTLCLQAVPELRAMAGAGATVGVLAHYLPSLVNATAPSPGETAAVAAAQVFLAPSRYMEGELRRLAAPEKPVVVVEPGTAATRSRTPATVTGGVRAVCVGNVTRGKRQLELLDALSQELNRDDPFQVTVIGDLEADSGYASACTVLADTPPLCGRVTLRGALAPSEVVRILHDHNLFVSASSMESYGMALAEACVSGLPIIARAGGNTVRLVDTTAGGELCGSDQDVARACARLCRSPAEHERRAQLAWQRAPAPRTWADAARDFVNGVRQLRL
jgi:glycosyltransferase involved in cell wall biosynthesis